MGRLMVIVGLLSIVIMGCYIKGSEAEMDEKKVMHVGGKVMCQDCSKSWNDWVNGNTPIKGCRVSVTCLDKRKKMVYYGSDTTDDEGEYNMVVQKSVYGREINPRNCIVRLVSSPDATCNVATNFGNGVSGVHLRQPTVVFRGMVKFLLEPFYYTTPTCSEEEPDTTTYQRT